MCLINARAECLRIRVAHLYMSADNRHEIIYPCICLFAISGKPVLIIAINSLIKRE
jgi:hypothetical protein